MKGVILTDGGFSGMEKVIGKKVNVHSKLEKGSCTFYQVTNRELIEAGAVYKWGFEDDYLWNFLADTEILILK